MKATVEVIRPIRVPAGSTLDGVRLLSDKWAMPGRHEIDIALMIEMMWEAYGYVEPEALDGKPVTWCACC